MDGREVGRSHSRSLGLRGKKHKPYLEFADDSDVLNDLDELIATFVYVKIKREKEQRKHHSSSASAAFGGLGGGSC